MQEAPYEERTESYRRSEPPYSDHLKIWSSNKILVKNSSGSDVTLYVKIIPDVFLVHPTFGINARKGPVEDLQQLLTQIKQKLFPNVPEIVRVMSASEKASVFSLGPLCSFAIVKVCTCLGEVHFEKLVPAGGFGLTIRPPARSR